MNVELNFKSLATALVWTGVVAWACYFFYEEELKVADMAPKILAMQGMSTDELSYVYEADLSDIYDDNMRKADDDVTKGIFVYMYENKKDKTWGRIIIHDRSTSSFKFIIRSNGSTKISGNAQYSAKDNSFSNNNYNAGEELSGCQVSISMVNAEKVKYQLIDKPNEDGLSCNYYKDAGSLNKFFTNIIHSKI